MPSCSPGSGTAGSAKTPSRCFVTVYLLLVIFASSLLPSVCGEGFCAPLLCSCFDRGANCTRKGFLVYPAGLPLHIQSLDLTSNDLVSMNATELELYPHLETLVLRRNKISKFSSGPNNVLRHLDLSYNRIASLSRGVDLSLLEAVTHLDLSNNQITTVPPSSFPSGKRLQILQLSNNQIQLLEDSCFRQLVNLQELRINKNKLSSLPKTVFNSLGSLRVLELSRNKLVKIPGLTFLGLRSVRILKLRKNSIKFLMDGAFYGLDAMEQLYLDRNQVTSVIKGWLYGVNKLRQLSLAYNKVDYIEDDSWEFCRELWQLDLRGNALKIVERDILRKLPSLTHLDLGENLISHIDAEHTFAEVTRLEVLRLDGNQLSHTIEDTPNTFDSLVSLRVLSLSGNAIKSVGRHALTGLRSLEQLDLSENVISTIQENPFEACALLSTVTINTTSLLCDCNIRWLPEWVNRTGVVGVKGVCAHPENLKGRLVTSISSDQFTCDDTPKPFLLVEPTTQIALRGKDLTLTCSAASTSSKEMRFTWKQDSKLLELPACVSTSSSTHHMDESVSSGMSCIQSVAHKNDGKGMEMTSQLMLKNLTNHHIGKYQCVVENKYGATYSVKADLMVYVFPRFLTTPTDITARGGDKAVLRCSATGFPAPVISWQKDSGREFPAAKERRMRVDTATNTYIINNIKPADMGVYTCTASSLAGNITTNITLSVLDKPKFVKPMQDKKVNVGETAVLECISSGSPKPSLTWSKNKGPLYPTERHFFTADNQLLIIVKAEPGDAGGYVCEMRNQLGVVTQSSQLTVVGEEVLVVSDPTTGIIVVAVVCCVVGTSLVWVFIIYHTRRRSNSRDWDEDKRSGPRIEGGMTSLGESGLPLLSPGDESTLTKRFPVVDPSVTALANRKPLPIPDDSASERDSGTGDSKRSFDPTSCHNNNPTAQDSTVDHVIRNFLTARGELLLNASRPGGVVVVGNGSSAAVCVSPTPLSDIDTGISSVSMAEMREGGGCSSVNGATAVDSCGGSIGASRHDSQGVQNSRHHRPDCPKLLAASVDRQLCQPDDGSSCGGGVASESNCSVAIGIKQHAPAVHQQKTPSEASSCQQLHRLPPGVHHCSSSLQQLQIHSALQQQQQMAAAATSSDTSSSASSTCPRQRRSKKPLATKSAIAETTPVETISLMVENPLYDSLPVSSHSHTHPNTNNAICDSSRPQSPASLISDSVAYCGRFPPANVGRMCPQCDDDLPDDNCPHNHQRRHFHDEVASVTSSLSTAERAEQPVTTTTITATEQPISFNTFHPLKSGGGGVSSGAVDLCAGPCDSTTPDTPDSHGLLAVPISKGKKRLSAIELPTGETYLPIEATPPLPRASGVDSKEYRGGGTLPRHGLQQEWLEASLNCTDSGLRASRSNLQRNQKERGSKISLFRNSKKRNGDKRDARRSINDSTSNGSKHHRRRRSEGVTSACVGSNSALGGGGSCTGADVSFYDTDERSDVVNKSADMFS